MLSQYGVYQYDANEPFKLAFYDTEDLSFPFTGTLVIPRLPEPGVEPDYRAFNHHDWLVYSLLYPRPATSAAEAQASYQMVFPTLRTEYNLPFGLAAEDAGELRGRVLCFVERDHLMVGHPFKQNAAISARPRLVLIRLEEKLPEDLPPLTRNKGTSLRKGDQIPDSLRRALSAIFGGTCYYFDLAGHAIDGYAAWQVLDRGRMILRPEPFAHNTVLVQFVDLHGQPISRLDTPLAHLEFDPKLDDAGRVGDKDKDDCVYGLPFPNSTNRTLKVYATDKSFAERNIQIAYWPGFDFSFKRIETQGMSIDLKKDHDPKEGPLPRFVRFCLFQPADEFQTEAGGSIEENGEFSLNKYRLFSERNQVEIFNTGAEFLADFYKELTEPDITRKVKAVYLTNWESRPHLFLHGVMQTYGIERNHASEEQVSDQLAAITNPAHHIAVRLDPVDGSSTDAYILLADHMARKDAMRSSFRVSVETVTATTPRLEKEEVHHGFVRRDSLYAWRVQAQDGAIHQRITASWKNSLGDVRTLERELNTEPFNRELRELPAGLFELSINNEDPPKGVLLQKVSYDELLARLGVNPGAHYHLLFLHLTSGRYDVIPVNQSSSPGPHLLHTFDQLIAVEPKAIALVYHATATDFRTALVTHFREIAYSNDAFATGAIPLSSAELGGLLRTQIAGGVTVKALYWDNFMANLSKDEDFHRGFTSNVAMTEVLNRTVNGRRGYAVRDAATRPLGAFHQKGIVIVKEDVSVSMAKRYEVVAYVGGMDLTLSRWSTEHHHRLDPERQRGKGWFDAQMKLVGEAAIDVLRNFKQRWEALSEFTGDSPCRPINSVPGLGGAISIPSPLVEEYDLDEPGPFVQITRTISPASCYSQILDPKKSFVDDKGELGSYHTYLKAIARARKFILINDQYLFSEEITSAIHDALLKPDGPECAIIVLPKDLSENDLVDPMIFKVRQRALSALLYGAEREGSGPIDLNQPQRYRVKGPHNGVSVADKVVLLTPINRSGDEVYVHSKLIIVDDVFMSIGSANFTYRGSTYEMELNGSVVARKLTRGGGDLIREQRVEICRRLLGLPQSYSTLVQDYYATFKLLKAVEKESAYDRQPTLNLHPLRPMCKQLPPNYAKKTGGAVAGFDDAVDFVMAADLNSPGLLWLKQNVIDIDGRQRDDDATLAAAASFATSLLFMGEFPRNSAGAYGRISFNLEAYEQTIRTALEQGPVHLDIHLDFPSAEEPPLGGDVPPTPEPLRFARLPLRLTPRPDGQPGDVLVVHGLDAGQLLVPVAIDRLVDVKASVVTGDEQPLGAGGSLRFDPTGSPPILPGSYHSRTLVVAGVA